MTRPAENLKAVHVEGVLVRLALQRGYMVAFEPSGLAAHDAAVAVAGKHGAAHGLPTAGVKVGVVSGSSE